MNMGKHTPGPWRVSDYDRALIWNEQGCCIVDMTDHEQKCSLSDDTIAANAALIAAAPDLLEACERVLGWLVAAETELGGPLPLKYAAMIQKPVVAERLRAAIAKAQGGK
jgi:hypothetical protein